MKGPAHAPDKNLLAKSALALGMALLATGRNPVTTMQQHEGIDFR